MIVLSLTADAMLLVAVGMAMMVEATRRRSTRTCLSSGHLLRS